MKNKNENSLTKINGLVVGDATAEVEALFAAAKKNPAVAAMIAEKRETLDATMADIRKRRNLNQADLAKSLGITQSSVSQFEMDNKRMMIDTLRRIGDAMDFDLEIRFCDRNSRDVYILTTAE